MDKKFTINLSYLSLTLYVALALKSLNVIPWDIQRPLWTGLVGIESLAMFFSIIGLILISFKPLVSKSPLASKNISVPSESNWWWFNHNFVIEWACVLVILFKNNLQVNLHILFSVFVLRQFLFNLLMFRIRRIIKKLNSP